MSDAASARVPFDVVTVGLTVQASESRRKDAGITLGTNMAGNPRALNPAELLLAARSACRIKRIERVTPILNFSLRGVELHLRKFGTVFNTVMPGTALPGVMRCKASR